MLNFSTSSLATNQNPVIDKNGEATVSSGHYALWETANGSVSTCSLTNPDNRNTVTFVVSGAPSDIMTTEGKPFNGLHAIPPNSPTSNVTVIGDFRGTNVTIVNISNPDAQFRASVVVAQASDFAEGGVGDSGGQNPVIRQSGQATVSTNHFCLWETANGSNSIASITNPGSRNTVSFVVSGAPDTILTTTGAPLNGLHAIPPNNPTFNVTAVGDFLGTNVTIVNISNPDAEFHISCQVSS